MIRTNKSWARFAAPSSILSYCLITIGLLTVTARAQSILIADFNDGNDDGWTRYDATADEPWGPGVVGVNGKGEYLLASGGPVPIDDVSPFGVVGSLWDEGLVDPLYSDGTLRARVRIEDESTYFGIGMRFSGSSVTELDGYFFEARQGEIHIRAVQNTQGVAGEHASLAVPLYGDLFLEASAIGNQFSFKVWPADEAEPAAPQVTWSDNRYQQGTLGVFALREFSFPGGYWLDADFSVVFDDLTFAPAGAGALGAGVPEPSSACLAAFSVAVLLLSCRRRKSVVCRPVAVTLMFAVLAAGLTRDGRAQATFDLGTFIVRSDDTGSISLPVPAGNYNHVTLTTDWSSTGIDPWSREAIWAIADGPFRGANTTVYADPGPAPNHQTNANPTTINWSGFLELPLTGPLDAQLWVLQAYDEPANSNRFSARWANTVLELSYVTPPTPPELTASLGVVAAPLSPFDLSTTGDFDTDVGVYSSTGAMIGQNDDYVSDEVDATVLSRISFGHGLPAGDYIAAVGGFNTIFEGEYTVTPGDVGGDYGLNVASSLFEGTLAAGEIAYVGFSIGDVLLAGDYNGNGQIEQGDLDLVLLHWGSDTTPAAWTNNPPEGAVDQQELDAVLLNWGSGAPFGAASSVPEPSGLLLALAALAMSRRLCVCSRATRTNLNE